MKRGLRLALALLALGAAPGWAQQRPPSVITESRPLIVKLPADPPARHRTLTPLTPEQLQRFRQAQQLRQSKLLGKAREDLSKILGEVPHHPLVLTELASIQLEQGENAAVERLAKTERTWAKDSLLLAHELSVAHERQGELRDAANVALEAWAASPYEADWAMATLMRLSGAESRGIHDALRKTAEKLPARSDLQRGWARIAWQSGDAAGALKVLERADRGASRPPLRWLFADEVLAQQTSRDTTAAIEALVSLAGDAALPEVDRLQGARRAWNLIVRRSGEPAFALRMQQALRDILPARWDPDLLVGLARGLRQTGHTTEARALLEIRGGEPALRHTVSLERALADLRDGPPEKALAALEASAQTSPEGRFRFGEALFFAGMPDSALAVFQAVAENPQDAYAGAALERIFLIEDAQPRTALARFGRIAYEEWRGNRVEAAVAAESLYRELGKGPLWAHAALMLSVRREAAGDPRAALEPALAVAEQLPEDRLAPVARQQAGDLYVRLKEEPKAIVQYEECLARYPRAWNAAEVRRRLEQLRRERRF